MKVTYLAYLRLRKKHPEATSSQKVVPGDNVEVPDKYEDFFEKEEIVVVPGNLDDPRLTELGKQKVAARKKKQAEIQEKIRQIHTDEDEDKESKDKKKDDFVLPLDDVTTAIVDFKMELQKKGLSKLEVKKQVAEYKEQLLKSREEAEGQNAEQEEVQEKAKRKKRQTKKSKKIEGEGKLIKDPETGEFRREG